MEFCHSYLFVTFVVMSREAARKSKTSGYLGLESHFHADAMKVRFKSKVTGGFLLSRRFATRLRPSILSRLKKNLWDHGKTEYVKKRNY